MDIKQAIIDASNDSLPMFGLNPVFQGEIEEAQLASANQVNVLIGISGGIKGNAVLGMNKTTALRIVSAMMGGMKVEHLDEIAKSAIAEAANMVVGNAISKMQTESMVNCSPPTIVTGERIFLLISRVPSKKLTFKLDNELMNIAVCIE